MTRDSKQSGLSWGRLAPILAVHLCGTLGFSIALPFLVFLVAELGGAPWTYGLVGATYSAAQMFGAPVLGRWSDRFGRRSILLLSQAGTAVAWVLFLIATQLPRLPLGELAGATLTVPLVFVFLARLFDGLTGGNISVANAYVADLTREDKASRQLAFGRMGMASSVGFTLGPALSGLLASWGDGYVGPILAALAISLLGLLLCTRLEGQQEKCPDGPPPEALAAGQVLGQEHRRCDRSPVAPEKGTMDSPLVRLVLGSTFVMFLAFNLYYASFPVHATQALGWTGAAMGLFYSLMSAAMFVVQGPVLKQASLELMPSRVFGLGTTGLVFAFLFFAFPSSGAVYAGGLLFAFGNGLAWATFQARAANATPESQQGAVQGAISSVSSLASIAGLVVGGIAYPWLEGRLFLVSSGLFVGVLLVTGRLFRETTPR
ncbi:MAG: MFS transporter [Acidobacteriota bacterium]